LVPNRYFSRSEAEGARSVSAEVTLMKSFATAIALDDQALLIDHHNRGRGWITIEQAVASRRAFAVRVHDDVLAVDADDPTKASALWSTAKELGGMEYPPVVVELWSSRVVQGTFISSPECRIATSESTLLTF
jgi:hypothetical protein